MFTNTPTILAQRMSFAKLLALCVIGVCGLGASSVRAQEIKDDTLSDRLEAASMFDAWHANIQSLRQFQVYVDISRSYILPSSGDLTEDSSQLVVKADLVSKKFCFHRKDFQSLHQSKAADRQSQCITAATYDSTRTHVLRCTGRIVESTDDFNAAWVNAEIPHVHAVGLSNFVTRRLSADEAEVEKQFTNLKDPTHDLNLSSSTNGNSIVSRYLLSNDGKIEILNWWTIDTNHLMPVATKYAMKWADGQPNADRPASVKDTQEIEWTSAADGTRVPVKIVGQYEGIESNPGTDVRTTYPVDYEVNFCWVSVNEKLDFNFSTALTAGNSLEQIESAKVKAEALK